MNYIKLFLLNFTEDKVLNIFKRRHRIVKNYLTIIGEQTKPTMINLRKTKKFWDEKYNNEENKKSWSSVISAYMTYECNDEERLFIDYAFFQNKSHVFICENLHISERIYFSWCEKILNDLTCVAIQAELMKIDITVSDDTGGIFISDEIWGKIFNLISDKKFSDSKNIKKEIEGMAFILFNGLKWSDLPDTFGSWKTIYNKFNLWKKSGLWSKIKNVLIKD